MGAEEKWFVNLSFLVLLAGLSYKNWSFLAGVGTYAELSTIIFISVLETLVWFSKTYFFIGVGTYVPLSCY